MSVWSILGVLLNAAIFTGLWMIDARPRREADAGSDPGPHREDGGSASSSS
ncbi:hypothetical protein [Hyphobacterium indicum]|uniref:hypothetical protein n=1 Tax=Hyphobacterium indicum TaxID=2162714 RepID=UPI001374C559|nr:hypothetical protein [Hyphobacterium indicum]